MYILVIRNSYKVSGAEIYYLKLQKAFIKFGLDYKLILISNNLELITKAKEYGIITYYNNTFGEEVGTKKGIIRLLLHLPNYVFSYLQIINKCVKDFSINKVLISGKTEKYILTPIFWFMKINTYWIEHGQVFTPTMSRIALFLYRISSLLCTFIFAESVDTQKDLLINNMNPKIIRYIGSGIDSDDFYYSNSQKEGKFIVGFMATLDWEKGVEDLVETIKLTVNQNKQIRFYILGDGPQLSYVKKQILQLNLLKYVSFFGRVLVVHKILRKIDVLLSPIKHPGGLSLSVLEAMSTGCVPIVTNIGGNSEIIQDNKTGFITSSDFSKFASEKIIHLFHDRSTLSRISVNARKFVVTHFSDKIFVNRLVKYLH